MSRIDIRPPADWRSMTEDERLAWCRGIVEETWVLYEAEDTDE